jgi:hypothetical protein
LKCGESENDGLTAEFHCSGAMRRAICLSIGESTPRASPALVTLGLIRRSVQSKPGVTATSGFFVGLWMVW